MVASLSSFSLFPFSDSKSRRSWWKNLAGDWMEFILYTSHDLQEKHLIVGVCHPDEGFLGTPLTIARQFGQLSISG